MGEKKEKIKQYLEAGNGFLHKIGAGISRKYKNAASAVAAKMEARAKAKDSDQDARKLENKNPEQKNHAKAEAKPAARIYEASSKPGESGLREREMNEDAVQDYARGQGVSSLVCGVLGLFTSPLACSMYLAFIPLVISIKGILNGKAAARALPPEQAMLARSGSALAIFALAFSLIFLACASAAVFGKQYLLYNFLLLLR